MAVNLTKENKNQSFKLKSIDIIVSIMKENRGYSTREIMEILKLNNFTQNQIEDCIITLSNIMDESMNGTINTNSSISLKEGKFYLNIPNKEIMPSIKTNENNNEKENTNKNHQKINKVEESRLDYSELTYTNENYFFYPKNYYMGNTCIQLMIPYIDGMTILTADEILYHSNTNSNYFINKYLSDMRRYDFPYSNIPFHIEKFKGNKFTYVNQLFDYNKPYVIIESGNLKEIFVLKNDSNVAAINIDLKPDTKKYYIMDKTEFSNFINKEKQNENLFFIGLGGELINPYDFIPNDGKIKNKKIHEIYKKCEVNAAYGIIKYIINGKELNDSEFNSFINNLSLKDLTNFDFQISIDGYLKDILPTKIFDTFFIIKFSEKDIQINLIELSYLDVNKYGVTIKNIPINQYIWDQLNMLNLELVKIRDPKIALKLNPAVKSNDIKQAKQKIKELKKINS